MQQPAKHDFAVSADRPIFTGKCKLPFFDQFKRRKKSNSTPLSVEKTTTKGTPDQDWLDHHGLNHLSRPHCFLDAFIPFSLTAKWNSYTTMKAQQENAGELGGEGGLYPDWKLFTVPELRRHIGVRMLHGIAPSPQLSMKFRFQQ